MKYTMCYDSVQSHPRPRNYTSILSPFDWNHEHICVWAILRRVGVDGKTGASIRYKHFQITELRPLFFELISEVPVLFTLLH